VEELFAVGLVALPWRVAGVEVALLHAGPAEPVLGPLGEAGEDLERLQAIRAAPFPALVVIAGSMWWSLRFERRP
jgi:hypothetical protein